MTATTDTPTTTYLFGEGIVVTVAHVHTDDFRVIHSGTVDHPDYADPGTPWVTITWADGSDTVDVGGDHAYTQSGADDYLPTHPYTVISEAVALHIAHDAQT